jgi:hypothetical protein
MLCLEIERLFKSISSERDLLGQRTACGQGDDG